MGRSGPTLSRRAEQRAIVGFAVQPLVTALLGFGLFPLIELCIPGGARSADMLDSAVAFALGTGLAGVLVMAFGAVPAFYWVLRKGCITRRQTLICGLLLGNLPGALIVGGLFLSGRAWDETTYGFPGAVRAILVGSLIGVVSAWVFWRIAGTQLAFEVRPQ